MKKIGFVGLGNMGSFMSKNLSLNNYIVNGFDINEDTFIELKKYNIIKKETLADISHESEIIITMLPNAKIVEEVWISLMKNLEPNKLIVDCSTIDIKTTVKLQNLAKTKNILSLDAPVSGGTVGAENGTLTFMVGGSKGAYKKILPLFEIMGNKSIFCGDSGSGQAIKMCNNLLLAITMSGLGEAIKLAKSQKLNMKKFYEVLSTSTGSCWALNNYCPIPGVGPKSPADNSFKPGFSSELMLKDLSLAISAANDVDMYLELGKRIHENYKKKIDEGMGSLDFSNIIN